MPDQPVADIRNISSPHWRGETIEALELRGPLPDEALRIVAKGEKEDKAHSGARL